MPQLCYLGKDTKSRGQFSYAPAAMRQLWCSPLEAFRCGFLSPPVLQKPLNGPWLEEEELALDASCHNPVSCVAAAFGDAFNSEVGWHHFS